MVLKYLKSSITGRHLPNKKYLINEGRRYVRIVLGGKYLEGEGGGGGGTGGGGVGSGIGCRIVSPWTGSRTATDVCLQLGGNAVGTQWSWPRQVCEIA